MSRSAHHALVALSIVAALSLSSGLAAAADEKKACVAAYEQSQVLRNESKLSDAKKQLLICARDVCPQALRTDCNAWLAEVDANMPSIVIDAKDSGGKDVASVKVSLDGKPVMTKLDGRPMSVDPGAHTFKYETDGYPTIEEQVIVKQGEKNRKVSVTFKAAGDPKKSDAKQEASPPPVTVDPTKPSNRKTVAYVVGGAGVVALGVGGIFYLSGKGAESDLRGKPCAATKTCPQSDVDDVKQKYLYGDIAMAVGVISLGVGTVLYVTAPKSADPATAARHFDVAPLQGGGFATYAGTF